MYLYLAANYVQSNVIYVQTLAISPKVYPSTYYSYKCTVAFTLFF